MGTTTLYQLRTLEFQLEDMLCLFDTPFLFNPMPNTFSKQAAYACLNFPLRNVIEWEGGIRALLCFEIGTQFFGTNLQAHSLIK